MGNSCFDNKKDTSYLTTNLLSCDAETIAIDSLDLPDKQKFPDEWKLKQTLLDSLKSSDIKILIHGGKLQNSEFAHSGSKSIKSSPKNKYALVVEIPNVQSEDHYRAEIWCLGNMESGLLVASGIDFWTSSNKVALTEKDGWQKLVLDFYIPPTFKENTIKIFFQNNGTDAIYVDDLKIEKIYLSYPDYAEEALKIEIDPIGWKKLEQLRLKAFENKMLITTKKSYVKVKISFDGKTYNADVRLKGDWLDHLAGDKWSFRIKLEKGSSWRGMRSFNIQTPIARGHLDEWVAHQIAEQEDILTTRYEYIPVILNGKSLGLYTYEEHFEKHLVEFKNRREGPIIKFSEEHLWQTRKLNIETGFPSFEAAEILPFKQGKTAKNPKLKTQFIEAQNLLDEFRNCTASASEIFDIDKMAKFLAFNDLIQGQHGLIWHNLRFYYNPVISKLEPIAYDLYTEDGPNEIYSRALVGNFETNKIKTEYNGMYSYYHLFSDPLFTYKYIQHLEKYSEDGFIKSFFEKKNEKLSGYEKMLQAEFSEYNYSRDFLQEKQKQIRAELPEMKEKQKNDFAKNLSETLPQSKALTAVKYPVEMLPYFLQTYSDGKTIKTKNYYPHDFEILGYYDHYKKEILFSESIKVSKYEGKPTLNSIVLQEILNKKKIRLIVEMNEFHYTLKCPILPWEKPSKIKNTKLKTKIPKWMHQEGNKLTIRKGKYFPKEPIVIPSGYEIYVEAHTLISFSKGSGFWSESPVYFQGEKNKEIFILGEEGNIGFTIIQTDKKSELNYVEFNGLDTYKKGNWELTGAVSFYEADVEIVGCAFINNLCEDALNIVRSEFLVKDCSFNNIYSDAFDSDFCTGELLNSSFDVVANDAIDFSGSQVLIKDCKINNINDKAISGGENSQLTIEDCTIKNAKMALASKDKSVLKIENSSFKQCDYGFVIFIKKPEYGSASIEGKNVLLEDVKTPNFIEINSVLILDGKTINGDQENVVSLFY